MKNKNWRTKLHEIIFEAETKTGKTFDIILLIAIILSVLIVMLESVRSFNTRYKEALYFIEWFFTILFTIEYILRIISVKKPIRYIFSFYGIIDLLSILPTFIGIYIQTSHSIRIIRILRLMRVFRVLKLIGFVAQAQKLKNALKASQQKITVFLLSVVILVVILGTMMYMIESAENGFTSIPKSIYWAIVTLTTVGYGDMTPQTVMGQSLASIIMIIGYAIIAVPTGIVTSEMMKTDKKLKTNTKVCVNCNFDMHEDDANFCKKCGYKL